jgi:hypothetical protein
VRQRPAGDEGLLASPRGNRGGTGRRSAAHWRCRLRGRQREAIRAHPAVADAVAEGIPDECLGEKVKAYVRLRIGQTVTAFELRNFLKQRLAPFEMPKQIEFVKTLPHPAANKSTHRRFLANLLRLRWKRHSQENREAA